LAASEPKLALFVQVFERLHQATSRHLWRDYRVFVSEESVGSSSSGGGGGGSKWSKGLSTLDVSSPTGGKNGQKKRVVHFWSFSPGIALEELRALHVRSIILTSGSLSDLT
jgi:hypothetical protein